MWRLGTIARLFVFGMLVVAPILSRAQQSDQSEGNRKVVARVAPRYPELARTMNLRGLVKVEAVVAANGTVKSVDPKVDALYSCSPLRMQFANGSTSPQPTKPKKPSKSNLTHLNDLISVPRLG